VRLMWVFMGDIFGIGRGGEVLVDRWESSGGISKECSFAVVVRNFRDLFVVK
jgi:hypothetical protein